MTGEQENAQDQPMQSRLDAHLGFRILDRDAHSKEFDLVRTQAPEPGRGIVPALQ